MRPPYLAHFMEGRARLRHPALAAPAGCGKALALLGEQASVLEVRPGTGSLLILLAPDADFGAICRNLEAAMPDLCRPRAEAAATQRAQRRALREEQRRQPFMAGKRSGKRAVRIPGPALLGLSPRKWGVRVLLGSFGLTLLAGFAGNSRAHVLAGSAFGLLAARHLWVRRKAL